LNKVSGDTHFGAVWLSASSQLKLSDFAGFHDMVFALEELKTRLPLAKGAGSQSRLLSGGLFVSKPDKNPPNPLLKRGSWPKPIGILQVEFERFGFLRSFWNESALNQKSRRISPSALFAICFSLVFWKWASTSLIRNGLRHTLLS
jgi:hypothetical protein